MASPMSMGHFAGGAGRTLLSTAQVALDAGKKPLQTGQIGGKARTLRCRAITPAGSIPASAARPWPSPGMRAPLTGVPVHRPEKHPPAMVPAASSRARSAATGQMAVPVARTRSPAPRPPGRISTVRFRAARPPRGRRCRRGSAPPAALRRSPASGRPDSNAKSSAPSVQCSPSSSSDHSRCIQQAPLEGQPMNPNRTRSLYLAQTHSSYDCHLRRRHSQDVADPMSVQAASTWRVCRGS
jgi:hypothetical protein